MKKRSIIIFPNFDNIEEINKIREQYDPLVHKIVPHITLVFPFYSHITTDELKEHVKAAISNIKSFAIQLNDLVNTDDGYLLLNVSEGKEEVIRLHNQLYTNILKPYKNTSYQFNPHLTVGRFGSQSELNDALKFIENIIIDFNCIINEIVVEEIDVNENSIIELIAKFS